MGSLLTLCQGSPLLLGLDEASPWRNGAHEQQPALLVSYKYLRATIQYWRTTDILLWIDMLSDPDCPDNLLGEASLPPDTAKAFSTFVASRGLNARGLARTSLTSGTLGVGPNQVRQIKRAVDRWIVHGGNIRNSISDNNRATTTRFGAFLSHRWGKKPFDG